MPKFMIVGENHAYRDVVEPVKSLIQGGGVSTVFLEALRRGPYVADVDSLKGNVYEHNPEKYDEIIRFSLEKGVAVHGIDAHGAREGRLETMRWAEYIVENTNGSALVIAGAGHVNYSFTHGLLANTFNVPDMINLRGVPQGDIVTMTFLQPTIQKAMGITTPEGEVYHLSQLPIHIVAYAGIHGIADFVYTTGKAASDFEHAASASFDSISE